MCPSSPRAADSDYLERKAIAAERMAAAQEDQTRALWCLAAVVGRPKDGPTVDYRRAAGWLIRRAVLAEQEAQWEAERIADTARQQQFEAQRAAADIGQLLAVGLDTRTYASLDRARAWRIDDIRAMSDEELGAIRNIGTTSMRRVRNAIARLDRQCAPRATEGGE